MQDNEMITQGLVILAKGLGIEPEAMMVSGGMTDNGYVLMVHILPEQYNDPTPEDVIEAAERIIGNG